MRTGGAVDDRGTASIAHVVFRTATDATDAECHVARRQQPASERVASRQVKASGKRRLLWPSFTGPRKESEGQSIRPMIYERKKARQSMS